MSEGNRVVAIFEEPSAFRNNVAEAVIDLGYQIEAVGNWGEACAFMERPGQRIDIGVLAMQLPGAPQESLLLALQERFVTRFPFFSSVGHRPDSQVCLEVRQRGGCGFIERQSSIREIAFRIDACMRGLKPSTFVAAPRVPLAIPVLYSVATQTLQTWRTGILRNLSRSGVYMSTPFLPQTGEVLELSFALSPEGFEHMRCHGRVVRHADVEREAEPQNGVGIAFESLSYEMARYLTEFAMQEIGAGHFASSTN